MQLRTYCKAIVIAGILFIWSIKFGVRPYLHPEGTLKFMTGVAPNFAGAFLVPFAAYWLYTHADFFNGCLMRFVFFSDTRIVCLFGFLLAVINEYVQLVPIFGRTFDYFDILFSGIGLVFSYCTFSLLQQTVIMSYDRQ